MSKKIIKSKILKNQPKELDGVYILKIILYIIVGSLWVKIIHSDGRQFPIPIGLIIGIFFAYHDHFKIDRKIEFAVLIIAAFVGFWTPIGIYINLVH
ncbi:MAG: hypothetical protein NVSMB46_07620 [Candidatus Saccharimonadales bacterium]